MNILVTGGSGFIGSNLIRYLIDNSKYNVANIDNLSYAGNLNNLDYLENNRRYKFFNVNIIEKEQINEIVDTFEPNIVIHLAAESHVDRSIDNPEEFIKTNIFGTFTLLEVCRKFWQRKNYDKNFRFIHISTDEVFGDLSFEDLPFSEENPYNPSSPYSASKASSDHLARAWYRTFGFPVIVTNCSNNYGPYQFPEKLIPITILRALNEEPIQVYGDGGQIRDWLHVDDHVNAIFSIIHNGKIGESYNIGANEEKRNIEIVEIICSTLDKLAPRKKVKIKKYSELITFVEDRAGHDLRYAINSKKLCQELNWEPKHKFAESLEKTIVWYLNNLNWCDKSLEKSGYKNERLGLVK